MANLQGIQAGLSSYTPVPNAGNATDLVPVFGDVTLPAGTASGDIFETVAFPANHILVDVTVDTESLGTTFTADVGVMSGAWGDTGARTCGNEVMTGKAFGTTGIYRADKPGFSKLLPSTTNRSLGIKGTTIGTPTTGAKVRVTAFFRPQIDGI